MPFKETRRMDSRIALFMDDDTGAFPVDQLCRRHGVSRKAFYFWKHRRDSGDPEWFKDRSHAVAHCPHVMDDAIAARLSRCGASSLTLGRRRSGAGWRTRCLG